MGAADSFVVVVHASFAMIDVELALVLHGRIDCTVHFFQFDGGKIQHRSHPFRRVGIGRVDLPTVDELGRTGEQAVEDMVGQEHVQRVIPAFQGRFVPIQFFISLA